jgi:hypothetical protein
VCRINKDEERSDDHYLDKVMRMARFVELGSATSNQMKIEIPLEKKTTVQLSGEKHGSGTSCGNLGSLSKY